MTLHYTITEEDYIQYNLYCYKHSKTIKRQILSFRILMPILLLAVMLLRGVDDLIFSIVFALFFCAVWIFLVPKIFHRSIKKSAKQFIKEGKGDEFIGEKTLSILDDKIHAIDATSTVETLYKAVDRIEEDGCRLYVFLGALTAYIVPFAAFENDQQKAEFICFIKERAEL